MPARHNQCAEDPAVVAKRQEMVHTGAVDFSSFGFDDFDEPEEKYVLRQKAHLSLLS